MPRLASSLQRLLASAGLLALAACGARSGIGASGASGGSASVSTSGAATSSSTALGCADAVLGTDALGAGDLTIDGADAYWTTADGNVMKSSAGALGAPLVEGLTNAEGIGTQGDLVLFTAEARVLSVPRNGGPMSVVADGQNLPMVVAADAGAVYWLNHGQGILAGSVVRSVAGGAPEVLLDQIDTPSDMVIDDDHVYFAAALAAVGGSIVTGPLVRIAKATAAAEVLATDLHEPAGLAVDATHVYWIEQVNDVSSFPGRLRSLPKGGGGAPTDIASTEDVLAIRVTVDAEFAWVTGLQGTGAASKGVLWRAPLAGGSFTEIASTPTTLYAAVKNDAAAVYWTIAWGSALGPVPLGSPSVRKICK